jgi:hypothetical protein
MSPSQGDDEQARNGADGDAGEPSQPDLHVWFGGVDVAAAVRNLTARTSIEELPSADFILDVAALPEDAIVDYLAEVRITAIWQGVESPLFTGAVVAATPNDGQISIECRGATALEEQLFPPFAAWNLRSADVIHLIARSSGFPEDRLRIDGLDELPREAFEVAVPLRGVVSGAPVRIGGVKMVPRSEAEALLYGSPPTDLAVRFLGAETYAIACVSAATAYEAEQSGLAEIDLALAWLAVRARYGLVALPDAELLGFRRTDARTQPARERIVCARGLQTQRRWLRSLEPAGEEGGLSLDDPHLFSPRIGRQLTLQDRQALLACRRAAVAADPLGAVTSLSDAIEFYAAGAQASPLFTRSELKMLRQSLPGSLTETQHGRVLDAIAGLNAPPVMTRLRVALENDDVPVSETELMLLQRLRKLRNDAVHGREAELPTSEDLQHAVGVVSRMLAYRIHRRASEGRTSVTEPR